MEKLWRVPVAAIASLSPRLALPQSLILWRRISISLFSPTTWSPKKSTRSPQPTRPLFPFCRREQIRCSPHLTANGLFHFSFCLLALSRLVGAVLLLLLPTRPRSRLLRRRARCCCFPLGWLESIGSLANRGESVKCDFLSGPC